MHFVRYDVNSDSFKRKTDLQGSKIGESRGSRVYCPCIAVLLEPVDKQLPRWVQKRELFATYTIENITEKLIVLRLKESSYGPPH